MICPEGRVQKIPTGKAGHRPRAGPEKGSIKDMAVGACLIFLQIKLGRTVVFWDSNCF